MKKLILIFLFFLQIGSAWAADKKVQELNFEELSLKGTIRNPEGAYLVQKKGVKFLKLYNVQQNMDKKIRESEMYIR